MSDTLVLIAEPDALIRTPLAEYLRDCGFAVVEATTGTEAMTLLESCNPPIKLLLAAVDLDKEPNGFALARWARAHRPGMKVLLAGSVEKAADAAVDLCDEGPDLARPYDSQMVVDRIRRLLASKSD